MADRRVRPLQVAAIAGLASIAAYGHVVYPAWLWYRTRGLASPETADPPRWPGLSVVVAAYREEAVIAAKVADLERQGYPGALEIVVVADDPGTAAAARRTSATVLENASRLGKSEAVNRGVSAARQPLVVLTDANAALAPGALRALARHFQDPSVAGVAGEKRVDDGGGGQQFYWRFESWLKTRESRTGTTIGMVGELSAFRREHFRPLPPDVAADDLWLVLDLIEGGGRVVYDPSATTHEEGSETPRAEWERRTRAVDGVLDVLWRRRRMLSWRGSPVAGQLWGHRAVRSSAGPVAHVLLLVISLRAVHRSALAALFAAGHLVGLAELVRWLRGSPSFKPARLIAQVLFLQAVGLGGLVRYLRGDRPALWPKSERTAPLSPAQPSPNS